MSYYNGSAYTFTWDGRRLATAVKGSKNMSFNYNDEGIRASKTVNGVTTHYVYSGNLLISEYTDTETTVYIYDVNGSPIGFRYRLNTYADDVWDTYWYVKNVQGDIVEIYSSAGVKLVTYKYDAWGNTTVAYSNNGANTTAVNNNLTYRGYYYDSDLGLYYLQSRYYDANICRFINADGYLSTGQGLTGYNMFAYCGNNPVMRVDPTGQSWNDFWDSFTQALQQQSLYFVVAAAISQIDTPAPGPADIASGLLILGGLALCVGIAVNQNKTTTSLISTPKDQSKDEITTLSPKDTYTTYYHVTTPENAASIKATGIMTGSNWEGGYVYAWKTIPNEYAIENSGAHMGVTISFKTNASFVMDTGIVDPKVQLFGPVVSTVPGPILVWDVQIVG